MNPKGSPESESAPKRASAEGSPVSHRARDRRLPTMAERVPLSLVVITRDAASDIAACIASASFAAEAVVVDSGSRDDTVDVARARARASCAATSGLRPAEELRGGRPGTTGCCASMPTSASRR